MVCSSTLPIVRFKAANRVWQSWPGFVHNQTYLRKDLEHTPFPLPPKDSVEPIPDLRNNSVDTAGIIPPNGMEEKGIEGNGMEEKGSPAPPRKKKVAGFSVVNTRHDDPRVATFLEILAQPQVTDTNAQNIIDRVPADAMWAWREALEIWAANSNWPIAMDKIFDRFDRIRNAKKYQPAANGNGKHAMPDTATGAMEILRQRAAARGETI